MVVLLKKQMSANIAIYSLIQANLTLNVNKKGVIILRLNTMRYEIFSVAESE
jgi:hypothetical protein